jgi:hypothetical protein
MLGLLWFAVSLTGRVRVARRRLRSSRDGLLVIDGCCGALIGFLLPASLSAPTITSVTFFFLLALLVACVARVEVQARARPPAMAAIGQGVLSGPAQYRGEVGTG